jgi:hypothetical protein
VGTVDRLNIIKREFPNAVDITDKCTIRMSLEEWAKSDDEFASAAALYILSNLNKVEIYLKVKQ